MFAGDLEIARVTPFWKGDDHFALGHPAPISVFPSFSKILEQIMFSQSQKYFRVNKLFT